MKALNERKKAILEQIGGASPEEREHLYKELMKISEVKAVGNPWPWWRDLMVPMVNGAFSIIGIWLILNFEKADIVVSKALPFVKRPH